MAGDPQYLYLTSCRLLFLSTSSSFCVSLGCFNPSSRASLAPLSCFHKTRAAEDYEELKVNLEERGFWRCKNGGVHGASAVFCACQCDSPVQLTSSG